MNASQPGDRKGQRVILESARHCWEEGRGHPLLQQVARASRYDRGEKERHELFGDAYYARTDPRYLLEGDLLECRRMAADWEREGKVCLPGYFAAFGIPSAIGCLREQRARARKEAERAHRREPTPAERHSLQLLQEATRHLAPRLLGLFEQKRTTCTVVETEVLLGQLKEAREYRSAEVYLYAAKEEAANEHSSA